MNYEMRLSIQHSAFSTYLHHRVIGQPLNIEPQGATPLILSHLGSHKSSVSSGRHA